jgi:hypothetical protein
MRYVVMIFRNLDREWTAEDDAALGRLVRLEQELAASGELVSAEGLRPPKDGRIVQIRDGRQFVTDGPFGEAKEQLAGFFMIDTDDDRAQEIAGLVSAAVGDRVELRSTLLSAVPDEVG